MTVRPGESTQQAITPQLDRGDVRDLGPGPRGDIARLEQPEAERIRDHSRCVALRAAGTLNVPVF